MPTTSFKSRSPRSGSALETRGRSPLLREFLLHLASERGLAENTLLAYRRDLEALDDHLLARRRTFNNAKPDDYIDFLHG